MHSPAVCVKPEPEKLTVDPMGPELDPKITVAGLTVKVANADGAPVVSVKVIEYGPPPTFAMMKLPPIVPSAIWLHT